MRVVCTLLALLLASCGYADATATNRPRMAVEIVQADSARVIAQWSRPCDVRGCIDSSRVVWRYGTQVVTRSLRRTLDTLWVTAPTWGDSLRVSIEVSSIRRRLVSDVRTASVFVRRLDAPPPPVDSLRVDTLTLQRELAAIAVRDSFPLVVSRDTLGRREGAIAIGSVLTLCAIGRNRYTGVVAVLTDVTWPADVAHAIERRCERARAAYAAERSG